VRLLRSSAVSASEAKEYPRAVGLTEAELNNGFGVAEQTAIKNVLLFSKGPILPKAFQPRVVKRSLFTACLCYRNCWDKKLLWLFLDKAVIERSKRDRYILERETTVR
jgi:hypothetical protein